MSIIDSTGEHIHTPMAGIVYLRILNTVGVLFSIKFAGDEEEMDTDVVVSSVVVVVVVVAAIFAATLAVVDCTLSSS